MQKLSTCIREGAKKRPQAFGDFIGEISSSGASTPEYSTCALGAAYEHITGGLPYPDYEHGEYVNKTIYKACGLNHFRVPYPEETFNGKEAYLFDVVSTLNDTFKWTRERIADYLDSIGY
jgi:hypothetical protein